jgi:hypothetical protein
MTYAAKTTVTVDRSKLEIERILKRWGADQFAYGWQQTSAMIGFRVERRNVRLVLPLPREEEYASVRAYDQAVRQRWRALNLVLKAKLEAVEIGISTIEAEFLAGLLLPDGSTMLDWAQPQIERAYTQGIMPSILPGLAAPK